MMQVFVLSVQNACRARAIGSATALTQFARSDGRDARRHGDGRDRQPRPAAAASRRRRGERDPPPAAALRERLADALQPAFLAAACVCARRLGDRRHLGEGAALRRSLDEIAAVDAAAVRRRGASRLELVSDDFMPLDGWDHVELWVGNAKQAAYYYEHAFGFRRTAYAGPETGVRDRASYVLEQNDIRLVVTSALHPDHEIGDLAHDARRRREGHRAARARRERGVPAGGPARRARRPEPRVVEDEFGKVELATIATYGDVVHTFVEPQRLRGRLPARATSRRSRDRRRRPASGCSRSTTSSATSSSAAWTSGSSSTSGSSG